MIMYVKQNGKGAI